MALALFRMLVMPSSQFFSSTLIIGQIGVICGAVLDNRGKKGVQVRFSVKLLANTNKGRGLGLAEAPPLVIGNVVLF